MTGRTEVGLGGELFAQATKVKVFSEHDPSRGLLLTPPRGVVQENLITNGPPPEMGWRSKALILRVLHLCEWLEDHEGKPMLTLRQSG